LPVIPLGVDIESYAPNPVSRAAWRERLGIAGEDVAFLFMGRLSYHAKAHPMGMFQVLEAANRAVGTDGPKIHMILAGWFANEDIEAAFRKGAADFAPGVCLHVVDGREQDARFAIWSAADVFLSLSDNYQETFGLTPVEAMACGLPVIVSDWDGYRDTVPEGVVGYRIPTLALPAGGLADLALAHATGQLNYDHYLAHTCQTVTIDLALAVRRCVELIGNPGLRAQFGRAARKRAEELYDWRKILRAYRRLWAELARMRPPGAPAARRHLHFPDPSQLFANYPTSIWRLTDGIAIRPEVSGDVALAVLNHPLWSGSAGSLLDAESLRRVIDHLQQSARTGQTTVAALVSHFADLPQAALLRTLAWLSKWGSVRRIPSGN
jgi:hypothetical protein